MNHDKKYVAPVEYDVYSRPVDPRNNMPVEAQCLAPGQQAPLSTERVASTIPKAGSNGTWQYPSPQMFWNSLVRKGKAQGASEEHMATVVAVHNNMNELTWRHILEWEKLRDQRPDTATHEPRLSRFAGRPNDLSLEARLRVFFGHPPPFDRHDWIVDRGGHEVRYVIDYYSDDSKAADDQTPKLADANAVKSILLDVRPALDTPRAAFDRLWSIRRLRARGEATPALPFFAPPEMRAAAAQRRPETTEPDAVSARVTRICGERLAALRDCGTDDKKCADAAIALQHCVASVVCPREAAAFKDAAKSNDNAKAQQAYAAMDQALEHYARAARQP